MWTHLFLFIKNKNMNTYKITIKIKYLIFQIKLISWFRSNRKRRRKGNLKKVVIIQAKIKENS